MSEISVASLPVRLQKQVAHARTAIDRGNTEYAINICRGILRRHPGCLAVRRLLRAAQLKVFKSRSPLVGKIVGGLLGTPTVLAAQTLIKKNPDKALDIAEKALGSNPTHAGALRVLAQAATARGLPETAVFALEAAAEVKKDHKVTLVLLAEAYIASGRSADAVGIADNLLADDPANMEYQELVKRASVAKSISAGKWEAPGGSYRESLRDEEAAVSLEQSGKVMASEEMTRRIIEETKARIEAEPLNLNHYRTIIEGYRRIGDLPGAIVWVEKARAIPVGSVDSNLERTEVDLRIELAESNVNARIEEVASSGEDPDSDAEVGRLREELSNLRIANLEVLTQKYPSELSYKFDLGELYEESGKIEAAIQQYQLVQRSPKFRVSALANLGACFMAKGLHDLAVEQLETAKAEISTFDKQKKEIVYRLACCYEKLGQSERAVQEFKQIYSIDISFRDVAEKIDAFYSRG